MWRWAARDDQPGAFVARHTARLIETGVFKSPEHLEKARQAYDGALRTSSLRY